jgi:CBS domain-containing protein
VFDSGISHIPPARTTIEERTMVTIRDVLNRKGKQVFTTAPGTCVYDALAVMAEKNIGALVVVDGAKITGIFSERDYARKVILKGRLSRETPVSDIMTPRPVVVSPAEDIRVCMRLMTDHQIRHLPVVEGEQLIGVISIGDVVKTIIEDQAESIQHLERYIKGR